MHAILLGAGFNIRKLLRAFSWLFSIMRYFTSFLLLESIFHQLGLCKAGLFAGMTTY